jgi:hypothetical protein
MFDDDDGGEREANAAALERMNARVSERGTNAEHIDELPIQEPGEEQDDEDAPEEGEERISRRERRRNRFRELQGQNEELKKRLGTLEELAQRLPDSNAIASQVQQNLQAQQQGDPFEYELQRIRREQTELAELYHAKRSKGELTAEQDREYRSRAQDLEDRRVDVIAERKIRQRAPQQGLTEQQVVIANLRAQNPDVFGNQRTTTHAVAVYQQLVAQGFPQDMETANEAIERTREAFSLPSRSGSGRRREPAPTPSQRERYAGSPAGGAGAGRAEPRANTVKITPEVRIMADAAFPHIKDPVARLQKWVNGPGRRIAAAGG